MITLPETIKPVTDYLIKHGTYPVVVGGYVRDALLGETSKDIDIEVYNVKNFETLKQLLEPFGKANIVGKSFGVLKMDIGGFDVDFALPRTEQKKAPGHRGFEVNVSGQLDFATAAMRRDFTVNAMGYDLSSSYLLDPYKGQQDLKTGRLRCVNTSTFIEDPLRVLRAVQMAARFHLECDDALMLLCRKMIKEGALDELPKERIFEEFKKLLLKSERPSEGFRIMRRIGLLELMPELSSLRLVRQDRQEHPEGDVWEHTLMCIDAMAQMRSGESKHDLTLMLAVLCHDFGKPEALKAQSNDYESYGVEPAERFLRRLTDEKELITDVTRLVRHHQKPLRFYQQSAPDEEIRRLATEVPLEELVTVAKANFLGRKTPDAEEGIFLAGEWLLTRAEQVNANADGLQPLLQGRDLLDAGFQPSAQFKVILDAAYDAQLKGEFDTHAGAVAWFKCTYCV
ncbi:MAG: HD domain-containing protein [Sulfurimonadaceae bacterium]|nr:HD domain-containing protein [Sulfurimonadaceae bacterium]